MKSIKIKVILVFFVVVLLVTTTMGVTSIWIVSDMMLEDARHDMQQSAELEAKNISSRIDIDLTYIEALAQNRIIFDVSTSYAKKLEYFIQEAQRSGYTAFSIADTNGNSTPYYEGGAKINVHDRAYFQKAIEGETTITDVFVSEEAQRTIMVIATPIYKNGIIKGVLYGSKEGTMLSQISSDVSYGESGYGYILNNDGTFVGHSDKRLVIDQYNIIEAAKIDPEAKALAQLTEEKILLRKPGHGDYVFEGKNRVAGFAPIQNTPWIMVVGAEETEILNKVDRIESILIGVISSTTLLGIVIAYFASQSISTPIINLVEIVKKQARLDFRFDRNMKAIKYLERKDEFGIMMKAMKDMETRVADVIAKTEQTAKEVATSSNDLSLTSQQAALVSEEVARTIEEIAKVSTDQAKDTESTANNIDALGKNVG